MTIRTTAKVNSNHLVASWTESYHNNNSYCSQAPFIYQFEFKEISEKQNIFKNQSLLYLRSFWSTKEIYIGHYKNLSDSIKREVAAITKNSKWLYSPYS